MIYDIDPTGSGFIEPRNLINRLDFLEFDYNLSNFHTYTISISMQKYLTGSFNFNVNEHIYNQINYIIYKEIRERLFRSEKFDYIDLSNLDKHEIQEKVFYKMVENELDYSSVILNNIIISSNFDKFTISGNTNEKFINTTFGINKFGKFREFDFYTDDFEKFSDGRICLFDVVKINLKNIIYQEIVDHNFNTNLIMRYDLAIDVGDSKIIFLYGDQYETPKHVVREIKLNSILNEN